MGADGTQPAAVWDRGRVLGLAGDDAARRAALGVGAAGWTGLGRTGTQLLWGACRGSGPKPYEVVVDLTVPAYSCGCPSRKVPCKHALALLLRWTQGGVPEAAAPGYVLRRSIAGQTAAKPATERPAATLADPGAAAARAVARAQRVADGLEELDIWIADQLRGGLAGLEQAGYGEVESMAARMIDAQSPGVAGMLRAIPSELAREGWPARVLDQLAALHLLIEAHRRLAELPPGLAATVRSRVGYPLSKSEVLARPGVDDDWLAVGQVDTVEYRLESRRVWLWGVHSRRWALWLTFAPPGQGLDSTFTVGARFGGSLHFYPGAGQYRAVAGEPDRSDRAGSPSGPRAESLSQARARFAALLAEDPWASRMPTVLRAAPVPPADDGGGWRLRDRDGRCRAMTGLGGEPWPLVALARGREVLVAAEWTVSGVRPMAVLTGESAGIVLRVAS